MELSNLQAIEFGKRQREGLSGTQADPATEPVPNQPILQEEPAHDNDPQDSPGREIPDPDENVLAELYHPENENR